MFALTVALAASNSFLIPTHQVNALIMGPGGYRVVDFMRAGGLMTVLFLVILIPDGEPHLLSEAGRRESVCPGRGLADSPCAIDARRCCDTPSLDAIGARIHIPYHQEELRRMQPKTLLLGDSEPASSCRGRWLPRTR